ncbi:MAG: O-succinylhomoserine sulfhydrylase [Flavobacteriales bacterium]|nr:O-succinylhomoserine sulfhydrylase [Flavobacteriales bacterium]|tara:strand:+ start:12517 stop:13695 length:1179 start_codon:yes stop_codon:yes gene_type:complete
MEKQDATKAIRVRNQKTQYNEHSTPMFLTSSFTFENAEDMRAAFAGEDDDAYIYSRFINPNFRELIDKACALEGTEDGYATATGMAAVYASIVSVVGHGDHVVSCRNVFGSSHTIITKILPRFGITHTFVDVNASEEEWIAAVQDNTKMIFLETPTNPGVEIVDLEMIARVGKKHGVLTNVDNCFATPFGQKPAEFGIDIVTHSATKYIDGQGRVLGGLILGPKTYIEDVITYCRSTGPTISPFNAWTLAKSFETLEVRYERHSYNALKLAEALEKNSEIEHVKYPFLPSHPHYNLAKKQMMLGGGIVTFELKGGFSRGKRFIDQIETLSITANLGDSRTIVTHPASTTHSKLSDDERKEARIHPGMIRVSCGLESIIDILADIEQALNASK